MTVSSRIARVLAGAALIAMLPLNLSAGEIKARERRHAQDMDYAETDVVAEMKFGREVAARVVGRYGYYDDQRLNRYVSLVGRSIVAGANRPELTFRFAVLDTNEINAYAAPGGFVFVTRGALAQMQDEAELAAVLAHEVGHITNRHVVKELNIKGSDAGSSGFARLVGGATEAARTAMGQMVDKAVDILFKDGYKREDEVQADNNAVLFSTVAGYDPSALVRFFERLSALKAKGADKNTEVLDKTHPAYDARIAWIKDAVTAEGIDTGKLKSNKERFQDAIRTADLKLKQL